MYFIYAPTPKGSESEWDALPIVIKCSERASAYLAAASQELGERLRTALFSTEVFVIASSELGPRHYRDFGSHQVLLIDSAVTLEKFITGRSTFPYERHLVSHSDHAN